MPRNQTGIRQGSGEEAKDDDPAPAPPIPQNHGFTAVYQIKPLNSTRKEEVDNFINKLKANLLQNKPHSEGAALIHKDILDRVKYKLEFNALMKKIDQIRSTTTFK